MVEFKEVEQTILSLLDDLRTAQAAKNNGFNIDKQLATISSTYEMDLEDLKSINFSES